MRIAFFYPESSIRTPIDPNNVWTSPRGLTGSEGSCIGYAVAMAELGHSVTLFTKLTRPGVIGKVICCPYGEWNLVYHQQKWDALCSWMTPEPLKNAPSGALRLFNQQVSDFSCCESSWEPYVDILTPLSHSHANYLANYTKFPRDKWRVAYNGVDGNAFTSGQKQMGKVIWASSHDRGLHWLLEAWPHIRARAKHATLHIFYDFNGLETFARYENCNPNTVPGRRFNELGQRSRYILEGIRRMGDKHGVSVYKSVSRDRIRQEMHSAEVLAYPLDPIHYTETFGVTVLEACASGVVPVICAQDCFEELWSPVSESVSPPYPAHKDEYIDKVAHILNDPMRRINMAVRCIDYSRQFDWRHLAATFERTLLDPNDDSGLPRVNWDPAVFNS